MIAPKPQRNNSFTARRERAVTLIAGIKSQSGLFLAADTEEQISGVLRTSGEKLHFINAPMANWTIVLAGAGHVDYILMARDLIQEKVTAGAGTSQEIVNAIRQSVQEIWRDYANHEGGADLKLLIGSYCSDSASMFTVVSGAAVRTGRNVEAMGIGDATFRSLADRFLPIGHFSYVPGDRESIVAFIVYATLQAKLSVPGVGGMTRVVRICPNGQIKWEKSFKIAAIQNFFHSLDQNIRNHCFRSFAQDKIETEVLLRSFSKATLRAFREMRKEVKKIEDDTRLV